MCISRAFDSPAAHTLRPCRAAGVNKTKRRAGRAALASTRQQESKNSCCCGVDSRSALGLSLALGAPLDQCGASHTVKAKDSAARPTSSRHGVTHACGAACRISEIGSASGRAIGVDGPAYYGTATLAGRSSGCPVNERAIASRPTPLRASGPTSSNKRTGAPPACNRCAS